MTNEVQIFEDTELGRLRMIEEDGKILFVASDVAKALGYSNISDAISRHCRYVVKHDIPHPQGKGTLEVNVILEGDVYRLITHSKLPSAEKFESWVFDEVLPQVKATKSVIQDYDLVSIDNNQVVVSSRNVAEHFEKEHRHVLESIRGILAAEKSAAKFFFETTYENRGKQYPAYLMNRDGFSLLVMGFTGTKAMKWKISYIEAFNSMEQKLKEQKLATEKETNKIALNNSKARLAELWMKLGESVQIDNYKQICNSYAARELAGNNEFILPLPAVEKKSYSATEIGKILGISANKVGKLANQHGLKIDKYGKWFYDKSPYSKKEVESFRYFDSVIDVLKSYL